MGFFLRSANFSANYHSHFSVFANAFKILFQPLCNSEGSGRRGTEKETGEAKVERKKKKFKRRGNWREREEGDRN